MISKEKQFFGSVSDREEEKIRKEKRHTADRYIDDVLKLDKKQKRLLKKQIREAHKELDISRL